MVRLHTQIICLMMFLLISPATAETLNLQVESGTISGAYDSPQNGQAMLNITKQSSHDFADFTSRHIGEKVIFLIDNKVMFTPVIKSPIQTKYIPISFPMTTGEWSRTIANLVKGVSVLQVRSNNSK